MYVVGVWGRKYTLLLQLQWQMFEAAIANMKGRADFAAGVTMTARRAPPRCLPW